MGRFRPEEPHKTIVELAGLLKRSNARRILDLGCGAEKGRLHSHWEVSAEKASA